MMSQRKLEIETLYALPNEAAFRSLVEELTPDQIAFREVRTIEQVSLYIDTPEYDLCRRHAALFLRPDANDKVCAVFKHALFSLLPEPLLVRDEVSEFTNQPELRFSEPFQKRLTEWTGGKTDALQPALIVKQERCQRLSLDLDNPIHLLIDRVHFTNPVTQETSTSFLVEVETWNHDLGRLRDKQMLQLGGYYERQYGAKRVYPSKYVIGLLTVGSADPAFSSAIREVAQPYSAMKSEVI